MLRRLRSKLRDVLRSLHTATGTCPSPLKAVRPSLKKLLQGQLQITRYVATYTVVHLEHGLSKRSALSIMLGKVWQRVLVFSRLIFDVP
jgi:hypothetical protein